MRALRCGPVVLLAVLALPMPACADGEGWQPGFHAPGVTGSVYCGLDFQGELVIGGKFTMAADVPAVNIARWDGTRWHPLGQGLPPVGALADYEGHVVAAGGGMVSMCGDDDVWIPLGEAGNGVSVLASFNGQLYAAGTFTVIDGVSADHIARWNGATWEALAGGGTDAGVRALAVGDGALYAGGEFTLAGGTPAAHVARWDGTAWSALGDGLNAVVNDLVIYQGEPVATGLVPASPYNQPYLLAMAWDGTAWRSIGADRTYARGLRLAADEDRLCLVFEELYYEHGDFYCDSRLKLGLLQSGTWTWLGGLVRDFSTIYEVCAWDGALVFGGSFQALGCASHGLSVWRDGQWMRLGPSGQGVGSGVSALAADTLGVLAAGTFSTVGPQICGGRARWDGSGWSALADGQVSGCSFPLAVAARPSGGVVSGGYSISPPSPDHPCVFHGWYSGARYRAGPKSVNALFPYEGHMLIGLSNCLSIPLVAEDYPLDGMGTWGPGEVKAFAMHQGRVYAGGVFNQVNGQIAASMAVLQDGTWLPIADGPGITVNALASWNGLLIAGGATAQYGGGGVVKAWDGATWRPLTLLPMDPVTSDTGVRALAVHDGDLIAGGTFTAIDGAAARGLARWDGIAWHEVGGGVAGSVSALLSAGDRLYVGGDFTEAGGLPSLNFACWQGALVPVRLTGFACARVAGGVAVTWAIEATGGARFQVWREEPGRARVRLTATPLSGASNFAFTDPAPSAGEADYWLEELAADGGASTWHGPAHLAAAPLPAALRLAQNHPNPFNPRTTFTLALPQAGRARLTIHDARGREVARLVDAELPAGERDVVWDGRDAAGRALASGVYLARLDSGGRLSLTKVTLAR